MTDDTTNDILPEVDATLGSIAKALDETAEIMVDHAKMFNDVVNTMENMMQYSRLVKERTITLEARIVDLENEVQNLV